MRGGRRPRRRIHPLVQPFEDQTVAGLEKPGRIQNKPGAGRIGNNSKKTSAAPYHYAIDSAITFPQIYAGTNDAWKKTVATMNETDGIIKGDTLTLKGDASTSDRHL